MSLVSSLVPSWAKDIKIGSKLINARAETMATKPAFNSTFAKDRRCIVPGRAHRGRHCS
jgi:putative SOS response-associated peptidase YedK